MKLSKLKTIIEATQDLLDEDIDVVIYTGREGVDSYTKARAKFTMNNDNIPVLMIVADYT